LDYCSCLLFGITDGLMQWLQTVQNAATHLITGTLQHNHITPVRCQLTGCLFVIALRLSWPCWSAQSSSTVSGRWTVNSSLLPAAVNYDRQTLLRASSNEPALILAIDHSQLLNHVCATVYLLNFVIPLFPMESFVER